MPADIETEEYTSELQDECEALAECFKAFENEMSRIFSVRAEVEVKDPHFTLIWGKKARATGFCLCVLFPREKEMQPLLSTPIRVRVAAAEALPALSAEAGRQSATVITALKKAREQVASMVLVLQKEEPR